MTTKRPLAITWLGHGTFLLTSPGGKRLLLDPWLERNPACPAEWKRVEPVDLVLITHGHADHLGDAARVARETNASVVSIVEICRWLETKGLNNLHPMNKGGCGHALRHRDPHGACRAQQRMDRRWTHDLHG